MIAPQTRVSRERSRPLPPRQPLAPSLASLPEFVQYSVAITLLKYTDNDVIGLEKVLREAGYAVTLLCDRAGKKDAKLIPNKANIERVLKTVPRGRMGIGHDDISRKLWVSLCFGRGVATVAAKFPHLRVVKAVVKVEIEGE
jgi:hypothetical protein